MNYDAQKEKFIKALHDADVARINLYVAFRNIAACDEKLAEALLVDLDKFFDDSKQGMHSGLKETRRIAELLRGSSDKLNEYLKWSKGGL